MASAEAEAASAAAARRGDGEMDIKRIVKHLLSTRRQVNRAFPGESLLAIERAIKESETAHVGEIRFAVEAALDGAPLFRGQSPRERAIELFSLLRVWDTEHNNGVLIYLLLAERQVELVADRGLNRHVDAAHWQRITEAMATAFRGGQFESGINQAIDAVHALLMQHYAVDATQANPNELPDAPLFL